jgi:predicted transcriptional regulator
VYKEGFNYLPVVNKDKKVLGVITPSSVINFLRDK